MPERRCAYGFSCAAMMLQPGLTAEDCPNRNECGTIIRLTEDEVVELQIARLERNRRIVELVSVSPSYAADILLNKRGCPQTLESLGLEESIANLKQAISDAEEKMEDTASGYIAPPGVEAHRYVVKRGYGNYEYNKLASKESIFPPQIKDDEVKVLHLSKDNDPRNIKARLGLERRNQLLALKTQLENASKQINQALAGVDENSAFEKVAEKLTPSMELPNLNL